MNNKSNELLEIISNALPLFEKIHMAQVIPYIKEEYPRFELSDYGFEKISTYLKTVHEYIELEIIPEEEDKPINYTATLIKKYNKEKKDYESLFQIYKTQPVYKYFAFVPDSSLEELSKVAKEEIWDFKYRNSKYFPILRNYLNYTFKRLQDEDKIVYSYNGALACFNSGLQTEHEDDIFIVFEKNTNNSGADWLWKFFTNKVDEIREFPNPELASYIHNVNDLVYDLNYEIHVDYKHIIDHNNKRLPNYLQGEEKKNLAKVSINGAVVALEKQLKRNYRLAIPHWYKGRIQLLLPVMINENYAEFAFVLEKDVERKKYYIKTILEIDKAYSNARVICDQGIDWLHKSIGNIIKSIKNN